MFFTSDIASSYPETALPQPELRLPWVVHPTKSSRLSDFVSGWGQSGPGICWGSWESPCLWRDGGGQFSPCPNTAHPTALGWLASHEVQREALVQENIIRPLTWLELCGLRQLKSSFMLMKQFLWLWQIELIAPKFNWKWDIHIIHIGERMGMINGPGYMLQDKPPKYIYIFFSHFKPFW